MHKKERGRKKRNSAFFQFLFQSYESLSESMTHNRVPTCDPWERRAPAFFDQSQNRGNENKQATTDSYTEGDRLQRAEYHQLF